MGYIKQLDSVRAIAVILVLFWHWIPRNSFINQFQTGPFGVAVFFVLSGFLITKILMENRNRAENLGNKKKHGIKKFLFPPNTAHIPDLLPHHFPGDYFI